MTIGPNEDGAEAYRLCMEYNPIVSLGDPRLKKECLPLPMSHDMKVLYFSLIRALKIISDFQLNEEWLKKYMSDIWFFEKDGEAGAWTLRHVFPDGHTVTDVSAESISAAIAKAEGKS